MAESSAELEAKIALLASELAEARDEQVATAIENARLFDEVQARNRELAESIEQQTATSEILRVISKSPTDIRPVLNAVAESAAQLCDAYDALIFLKHGQMLSLAAHYGPIPMDIAAFPATRDWVTGRAVTDRVPVHVHDLQTAGDEFGEGRSMALRLGHRTTLATPLLREDESIGALVIRRTEVRPFSDKQIELLQTFADQAVIAIENARLFDEVQARNRELAESLEQQTATGEILRVISKSPTDIQPVLKAVASSAVQLCDAYDAVIFLMQEGTLAMVTHHGPIPVDFVAFPATRDWVTGRAFVDRLPVHVHDLQAEGTEFPAGQAMALRLGHRTILGLPLLRDDEAIGALTIRRTEIRPFSDKQIALLRTFADQAVIAIENVRLFDEVQARNREVTEALEQQTATAEVLKTISSSAFDLDAVLQTLVKSASDLCHTSMGVIYLRDGDVFRPAMQVGWTPEFYEYMSQHPMRPGRGSVTSRAALTASIVHIPDALDDMEYTFGGPQVGHFRTLLGVPLIRDGSVMGVFVLARPTVKPFSQREIELVQTFSDQALIALENVRLFDEVQARNREVTEALEQQTATGAILTVIAASPTDIQPVLQVVAESAARFCDTHDAVIDLPQDGMLAIKAHYGPIPLEMVPLPITRDWIAGRAFIDRKTVHVHDLVAAGDEFPVGQPLAIRQGHRTIAATPLMRSGQAIGTLTIRRTERRPFSDKQINLLKTFADQAVIAIENVRLFDEAQARNRELAESLEQQTATGEILRVISKSPTDIQPVLDAVAESAAQLCDAYDAVIFLTQGSALRVAAHHGPIPIDFTHSPIGRGWVTGRAVADRVPIHVHDLQAAGAEFPGGQAMALRFGHRTTLAVPLLREDEAIGALMIRRAELRPFSDKQIELLKTFADQAVIAIENVRLFDEVQARTAELGEALQQQTATADVLKVISRSTFDLQVVLDTLVESAVRLCRADKGGIVQSLDGVFRYVATHGYPASFQAYVDANPLSALAAGRGSAVGRVMEERRTVQIDDVLEDPDYRVAQIAEAGGFRTILATPLLREGDLIGVFVMTRVEPQAFNNREIALVQTFADQAVIAIENVRLFDEVQARNREVTEALERQTATGAILRVIAASPTDIQPVLQVVAESAARFCDTHDAVILLPQDGMLAIKAHYGPIPLEMAPLPIGRDWVTGRAFVDRKTLHIHDLLAAGEEFPVGQPLAARQGHRTIAATPLMRSGQAVGALTIRRTELRPFSDKQIELVQIFADQAAIAIENVRLFEEVHARNRALTESLEQQTATNDVLSVISSSPTNLQPVFDMIAERSARLCEAEVCAVFRFDGELIHFVAQHGISPAGHEAMARSYPIPPGRSSTTSRAVMSGKVEQIPDVREDPDYAISDVAKAVNARSITSVPMLKNNRVIGAINVARSRPGLFAARQIALLQTFADQAVIAIENVRLFDEVQARTAELGEALQQQTATADVLKVISRSALHLPTVFDTLVQSAVKLCGANYGGIFMRKGEVLRAGATMGLDGAGIDAVMGQPIAPDRKTISGRVVLSGRVEHIPDVLSDQEYDPMALLQFPGTRALMGVPLLREGKVDGVFVLDKPEPGAFTPRHAELVQTFADQAVIAIENVRLFDEVQARTRDLGEALEQQTATADVLKAISRSAFDLQPVLQTLIESAIRLCGAHMGAITLRQGDSLHYMAGSSQAPELLAYERAHPHPVGRGTFQGRAALEGSTIHVADALEDPEYERPEAAVMGNFRAVLSVPLKRGQETIGVFGMARRTAGLFSPRQVELVETFADQAVIAIENVRLFDEVQARTAELGEALKQQTATADVLKVISRSTYDLQAVLDTLAESVARLCEADSASITREVNGKFYEIANYGYSPEFSDYIKNFAHEPGRGTVVGRTLLEGKTVQIGDVLTDPEYTLLEGQRLGGFRTALGVPLLREGIPVGVFVLTRPEPSPFTDKQIELVETFADQAVIAIENVRLFDEVQARTAELSEALQQQTATADVLKAISRSTFDLQPVLDTLAATAVRVCEADMGSILRRNDDFLEFAANAGFPQQMVDYVRVNPLMVAQKGGAASRAVAERRTVHLPDVLTDAGYTMRDYQTLGGFRTIMAVPLLLGSGEPIGVFTLARSDVRPFSAKQIELVETFADQAVIAIENVRLFDEVQARTAELGEALQQQTATADVLKVISRSTFDLQTVLDTLTQSAAQLCEADMAGITRQEPEGAYYATNYNLPPEWLEYVKDKHFAPGRGSVVGRALLDRGIVHLADVLADPEYTFLESTSEVWFRTVLGVPLMREGNPIGVLILARAKVQPFTDKQIDLIQTFADQAVIAIENARLFEEVQARTAELSESLQQQTATADVLKAISRSTFDLQPVLDTLAESAAKLCDADTSVIFKRDGDLYRWSASYGNLPEAAVFAKANPIMPGRDSVTGRVALEARAIHVSDVLADPEYGATQLQKLGGYRTILCVPILREGTPVGVFALTRSEVRDFTPRQIELLETFADQSGIAIENVRLFDEVQARTRELSRSLEDLRTAQDRLVQTEKLASLGQLTAGIAHEIKNPLNFVNNFSALSSDLIDDLQGVLTQAPLEGSVREEVAELTGMLKGNLDKVVQHGKRADSIVRNMLLHSRAGSGEHRPVDINAVVEESLNLAYHGARAEKPGFNVTLMRDFDPQAGDVDLYPQEITRVLLNLISNGFYATAKRGAAANGVAYEPTLSASTRSLGDRVEIRIRDNGTGIPPAVKEKMFNPFFTTKPAGEGTGLGLSLSHDIVVKQHAGTIDVDSEPGAFTEFRIVLPRAAASLAKSGGQA